MNYIIDNIFIGNIEDVLNTDKLINNNITYILNCARELDLFNFIHNKKLGYFKISLLPGQVPSKDSLIEINRFIEGAKTFNNNVLVHCYEGRVRAPTIVILYLMYNNKMDYQSAYELVKMKRTEKDIMISNMLKSRILKLINESD